MFRGICVHMYMYVCMYVCMCCVNTIAIIYVLNTCTNMVSAYYVYTYPATTKKSEKSIPLYYTGVVQRCGQSILQVLHGM